ncbi:MAG: LutC/YkgG family protein [Sciscionella sp.]
MVEDTRSEILARIRTALSDRPDPRPVPRDYHHDGDVADVLALAAERIADYRAIVHRVAGEDLAEMITTVLHGRGLRTIAAAADIPQRWQQSEFTWRLDRPPLTIDDLDGVDGVVTGSAVTIANTGTIVLDTGPRQGRRMLSLVPDYHLCVVLAEQIVGTVPEALARLDPTRPLTFISGPSATSDIELDRVEGVHGPRTLEVLLVEADPG